jgi:hypothetical protein
MRVAGLVAVSVLVIGVMTSCAGEGGGCDSVGLVPIRESAATRATSCAPTIEMEGTEYMQWGCSPVRRTLLGPIEGRGGSYVARSIDGVPKGTGLAVREGDGTSGGACDGWGFWADIELIDRDQTAANNLARSVNTSGTLQ